MARIRLDRITKTFAGSRPAVREIDLEAADGELLVLVGPSGCGKSTTLRLVAGLEAPTSGRIYIGDQDVTTVAPQDRDIAMVFQSYALYPHKTVRENLEFPLRVRRVPAAIRERRVEEVARALGIYEQLPHRPRQLSGGQRQRVALGRAMVRQPKAFLFDEPLSNLDATLRVQTRTELARMHRRLGATMLYVTHDQEEAMTLGDRVAVMHEGSVEQVDSPVEVYRRPSSMFVAKFIGSPSMNLFPCRTTANEGRARLSSRVLELEMDAEEVPNIPLVMGIRPNDIDIVDSVHADVEGEVDIVEPLGSEVLIHVALRNVPEREPVRIVTSDELDLREGAAIGLRFRLDRLHVFEEGSGKRREIEGGMDRLR